MTLIARRAALALGIITLFALVKHTYDNLSRPRTVSLPALQKPHPGRLGRIPSGHLLPIKEAPRKPVQRPEQQPSLSKEPRKSDKETIEYGFTTTDAETAANALTYPGKEIQRLLSEQNGVENGENKLPSAGCPTLPVEIEKVLIVILTGATEVYQKLPTLLLTTLKCLPEGSYLIFSDLEQEVAGVPVRDALIDVSEAMKTSVVDFEIYRQINTTYTEAGDMSALNENWKPGTIGGSTTQTTHVLDKWKWLPSLAASYDLLNEQNHFASKSKHPKTKKKWVFVMDTNTHLSILNLMLWLTELEKSWPEDQKGRLIYAGAQLSVGVTEYAHGDGGVLLSIPVIERISGLMQMRLARGDWEKRTNMGCCGDIILAEVLMNQEVSLLKAFPLLQTRTVASLDWSSRHWCSPVISWRESMPQEVEALWNFERYWIGLWGWEQPILYRDAFAAFIQPSLEAEKAGWINLSEEVAEIVVNPEGTERSHLQEMGSKDICRSVCETRQDCLQWMWRNEICTVSNVVRLGHRMEKIQQKTGVEDDKTQVISGWMLDRINEWIMDADRECKDESRWIVNN